MTTQALVMWAIVLVVGLPAVLRNPTAAALVLTWLAAQVYWLITGDSVPVEFYIFPDILVLAVIFSKTEDCNLAPYATLWRQIQCVALERSRSDRVVMFIYPLAWLIYVADIHPYHKWHLLFALTVMQFLAAGWESFCDWRLSAVSGGEAKRQSNLPADVDRFAEIPIAAEAKVLASISNDNSPTALAFIPIHSRFSGGVSEIPFHVPAVRRSINFAQILNAVIARISIYVVNLFGWPLPVMNGPSDTMGACVEPKNRGLKIAGDSLGGEGFPTSETPVPFPLVRTGLEERSIALKPEEFSSLRLIAEKLTECFRGWYFLSSHGAVPSRGGQGRASASTLSRPEFSSTKQPVSQVRGADADVLSLCSRNGMEAGVG